MTPRQHRKRERRQAYWRELNRRSQARVAEMQALREARLELAPLPTLSAMFLIARAA